MRLSTILSLSMIGAALWSGAFAGTAFATQQVIEYTYDTAGRVTSAIYDGVWSVTYAYDANGNITALVSAPVATSVEEDEGFSILPKTYALNGSAPNPFTDATTIHYQMPRGGVARMTVYNAVGQRVRTLLDEQRSAGYHAVTWDGLDESGSRVAAGLYACRLVTADKVMTRRMLVLR